MALMVDALNLKQILRCFYLCSARTLCVLGRAEIPGASGRIDNYFFH
jgi:hypothetical protein